MRMMVATPYTAGYGERAALAGACCDTPRTSSSLDYSTPTETKVLISRFAARLTLTRRTKGFPGTVQMKARIEETKYATRLT